MADDDEKKAEIEKKDSREPARAVARGIVEEEPKRKSRAAEVLGDVLDYVLNDVLIPTSKRMVSDIVSQSVEMALFGGRSSGGRAYGSSRSRDHVSYDRYYRDRDRRNDIPVRNHSGRSGRLARIRYHDRQDAMDVLYELRENCRRYGNATVYEYYTLSDYKPSYTDNQYGWTEMEMDRVTVGYSRDGWYVDLPEPRPLDDDSRYR